MKKLLALTVLASAIGFAAPVIQFSLVNPNLTGEVGSVVGWGFSLHVNVTDLDASTYYVLATGSDYTPNVGAVGYSKGSTVSFPGDADVIGINQGPLTPGYVSNGG